MALRSYQREALDALSEDALPERASIFERKHYLPQETRETIQGLSQMQTRNLS